MGEPDWHLLTMSPVDPVDADARNATIVTAFGYVSLVLFAFYWRMRRARVREVMCSRAMLQKAYAELNRRVAERTADLSEANEQLHKEVAERTRAEQELRAAHDELIQASKLAALGQMAAGITHELNQPLAALRGFSDNTLVLLERGDQASARRTSKRSPRSPSAWEITNQLKLFVGRARPRSARAPIVRALRNVVALLQKRLQGVEVEYVLVDADAVQRHAYAAQSRRRPSRPDRALRRPAARTGVDQPARQRARRHRRPEAAAHHDRDRRVG